ncbi:unnamed protein product [Urochloa humidicola]
MIDFLAKDLGLPLLSPYLAKDADFTVHTRRQLCSWREASPCPTPTLPWPDFMGDTNGCLVALNLFAQMHIVLLEQGIRELRRSYPGATIGVRMLRDAGKAGFDEAAVTEACCGAGGGKYNLDMDRMCGAPGASVCARPDERISWDDVHLTQREYRVVTNLLYHKGFASPAPEEFKP